MTQKTIFGLLAGAVVLVGGYFLITSYRTETQSENTNEPVVQQNETGKKMAFSEFIKGGGAYKCTVNQSVGGIETKGVTYLNGGLIRGEYATQVQGMNIGTTMIVRDGYTYSWSSMAPTMGYKSKIVATGASDTSAGTSGTYSFNAEQIGDYNCEPWAADASLFALPVSVTFTEINSR